MYMTGSLKIFFHFLLWPPQKGRFFRSGCFFQKCYKYSIFGMLFSPLQTPILSSMPEMLYVQHFRHAIINHILSLCKRNEQYSHCTYFELPFNWFNKVQIYMEPNSSDTGMSYLISLYDFKSCWNHCILVQWTTIFAPSLYGEKINSFITWWKNYSHSPANEKSELTHHSVSLLGNKVNNTPPFAALSRLCFWTKKNFSRRFAYSMPYTFWKLCI